MNEQAMLRAGNDREDYREFCQQARLPVFVQPWFLDAVCDGGSWEVALVRKDDEVLAAMPYFMKRKGPFRYLTLPPFVKHMGPFLAPALRDLKHEQALYDQLIDQLPSFHAFKQNFHPSVTNWLPFFWRGFQQTTYYTYRLPLQDEDKLRAGINRNMRRNLKKAQAILRVTQGEDLRAFYRLHSLSFERQGLPNPFTYDQLERHDTALAAHSARQLFFAEDENGRVHSAAYLIWDHRVAYYHLAGDDPDLRQSGSGIFLVWTAIRYAREVLGLEIFDFEGSMLKNVEAIRRQFGAYQQPYFFVWKYNSRLFRWLESLRNGGSLLSG